MLSVENPFILLGLPVNYQINLEVLERHYLALQRDLHPDKFANYAAEAKIAERMSGAINRAYTLLKDPLLRAKVLLEIRGIVINDSNNTIDDPTLLEEVLEWNEALQSINNKGPDIKGEINSLIAKLTAALTTAESNFIIALEANNPKELQTTYCRFAFLIKIFRQAELTQHQNFMADETFSPHSLL